MTVETKQEHRLVITVRPSSRHEGRLTVDDALQQVLDFLRVAEEAKSSLGRVHENFEWYLFRASTNSPFTVVAIAEPIDPTADITAHVVAVKETTARAFRRIVDGQPAPGWLTPAGTIALKDFFKRNANGINSTILDLEGVDRIEVDHDHAESAALSLEPSVLEHEIPARVAHGEIEGRLAAVGRYRNRPALFLSTSMYGPVSCVLADHLIEPWGDGQKVSDVWRGKRLIVFGRLIYWKGGRLSRVEAQSVRERDVPKIDIEDVFDPDFTAGLDPVEYLDRLHGGRLG